MKFRSCEINSEQVRLLLFKECEWRGRRLLFDSSAVQKVPAGKHDKPSSRQDTLPCVLEVTDGFSYLYKGPEEDAAVLGEMIFGAVAMNCKSVSLKIHIMDEPRRIMCTKVFCLPTSRRISRVERKTSDRADVASSARISSNVSKPLNVPSLTEDGVALSFSMDRGDSGFCGDQSSYSSFGSTYDYFSMFDAWDGNASQDDFYSLHAIPGRKLSTTSNGSWQRRTFQNIATRFELGHGPQLLNVPTGASGSDSQMYSNSSASGTSESIASGSSMPPRKSKLGLAVLISVADAAQLDIVRKCVEHSPQLQALVCRLRLATLTAGAGSAFVSTLHRASEDAARWLSDLIYGPRLQPTWLAMATSDARTCTGLADTLLADLCSVLAVGDTKTTNFFISTLLTQVLTYHLGWVTTVSPYDAAEHQPAIDSCRPYNALWAQLSDLCGSIGSPPRAARTIISGEKNNQFISRLLSTLAYFLRCGDVKRTEFRYKQCAIKETQTVSVNRVKTGVSVNTQSDSASTLVASDSSLKTTTFAQLRRQLSSNPECSSSSTSLRPSCTLKRNPTVMLSSLKASSDSSLNSTVSNDSVQEKKVVFVLGDDEQLVGLKNKSANGKCVKKSSRQNEPQLDCEGVDCDIRNKESPAKCCGQTLQHSKPIRHSGFKFEFDKYPQIVTNYMKSKNLEILDRHYIGKPGNLKLDNFQFDPMVVMPIQEEKCDSCEKCQLMESMLQTPTNASEMEYMNDMPRVSEPQYAKETVVTEKDRNHREVSPKTFVRRRKKNVVVVNLNNSLQTAKLNANSESASEIGVLNKTDRLVVTQLSVSPHTTPRLIIQDDTSNIDLLENTQKSNSVEFRPLRRTNKLTFTKSTNNLNALLSTQDCDELAVHSSVQTEADVTSTKECISATSQSTCILESAVSQELSTTQHNITNPKLAITASELLTSNINSSKANKTSSTEELTSSNEEDHSVPPLLKPLEFKRPEQRRSRESERDRVIEVKRVTEIVLPELCKSEIRSQKSGFDGSLLGGISDHYVPDLILQGTIEKPCVWEAELRRDLDVTAYLNKQMEIAPVQAVAIIGDTNTWEVRVVGRDCGTNGMSSLVGAMLDALPAMWKAKVPAHQCLSFLESKLREFCVLSKTLAEMLMSTDFCDIATLTKFLNIDVNDVPLLLAVATTHTPQVATRYGISYR